jgi:hypothetical protein
MCGLGPAPRDPICPRRGSAEGEDKHQHGHHRPARILVKEKLQAKAHVGQNLDAISAVLRRDLDSDGCSRRKARRRNEHVGASARGDASEKSNPEASEER